ncbi:MAG: hypothetical protein AAF078_05045, partial [Planctomycetota bacterium]
MSQTVPVVFRAASLAAAATLLTPHAAGQTADVLVAVGDQPIPTLLDLVAAPDVTQPATVENVLGYAIAPTGEWVARLSFFPNEPVEVAPGFFIGTATQRNIYYGDIGNGPELLLEDDDPLPGASRVSLNTPFINAAGDLAYTSFNNASVNNIGTISDAALINDTVLGSIGGSAPTGIGFQPGATIVSGGISNVELFEDGDAWVRIQATGLPANVVSSD